MATYSFLDTVASIAGPGGVVDLAAGAAVAEEGITVEMVEDKDAMTTGADGEVMHSLHAGKAARFTVRLLKTSPVNSLLSIMYDLQTASSALHGTNVVLIRNTSRGDAVTGRSVAFAKYPTNTYAKEGGMMEWVFNVGKCDQILGPGNL